MLMCLRKGNNCIIGLCQETSKVQRMYLAIKNMKISTRKSQQWSKSENQSTNNVFACSNPIRRGVLIKLKIKLQKTKKPTYFQAKKQETSYRLTYLRF